MSKSSMNRMNRRYEELVREFQPSLGMYVFEDGQGGLEDVRDSHAREMAECSGEELTDLIGDVPQDLAAMISCAIIYVREPMVDRVMFLQEGRLQDALQQMQRSGELPLRAKDDHPVAGLLHGLIETDAGCALYRDMAVILLWASRESEVRGLLKFRVERWKSSDTRVQPHDDAEVEGVERDEDDGGDDAEANG